VEITEVRVKLMEDSDDRLQAFCSITFDDCFVVRDLKIIEGTNGPFVAMPSRKLTAHCHKCGSKNHLRAAHCNQCGARQRDDSPARDEDGRAKLYADIAHPINSECRETIQACVIKEYQAEVDRAAEPGYTSRYDDEYDELANRNREKSAAASTEEGQDSEASSVAPEPVKPEASRPEIDAPEIQPPESGVRPPHTSQRDKEQTSDAKEMDDFGAGLF